MTQIFVVSQLSLQNGRLFCTDNPDGYLPLPLKQDDLGGSCAVFSLVMNLRLLNYIHDDQLVHSHKFDRRKPSEKLLYHLMEEQGLLRRGYEFTKLKKEIESYCKDLSAEYIDSTKVKSLNERINIIDDCISNDEPVIIGIDWPNSEYGHALLAIGVEKRENKISKIYCLDPGAPKSKICMWNCYIDTTERRGKYCCEYFTTDSESQNDNNFVKLSDILIVSCNK